MELALKQPQPKHQNSDGGESLPWRGRGADALYMLPGKHFDLMVEEDFGQDQNTSAIKRDTEKVETVLVVFLGGVTFSEISSLRFLSRLPNSKVNFLIATTCLLNGNTFLEYLQDDDAAELMNLAKGFVIS